MGVLVLTTPVDSQEGALGEADLVQVDDLASLLPHLSQFRYQLSAPLVIVLPGTHGHHLLLPDLLSLDPVLQVEAPEGGHRESLVGEPHLEQPSPLIECVAGPPPQCVTVE